MLTVKGPLSLFRASSFVSPFWGHLQHLSALDLGHGTKLLLVLQIHVLQYLSFYQDSCLFLWEKQCCLCPAFVPKWNTWEKCFVKCLSNQRITEEDCQLFWALLLWNFLRMASLQPQADVVTTPALGQIDKSTVLVLLVTIFSLLPIKKV